MFQFVTMLAQSAYCWRYSPYPKALSKLLFFYMQTLLALFAQFYVQKYNSGGSKRGAKECARVGGGLASKAGAGGRALGQANGHTRGDDVIAAVGKKAR